MDQLFVGIDVSQAQLDVHVRPTGEAWRVASDEAGIAALVDRLRALRATLIVLEATGGYETMVVVALAEAGLPRAIVNPQQIRDFARATGPLAKTDALDARSIATFAEAVRPAIRAVPDEQARALGELVRAGGNSSRCSGPSSIGAGRRANRGCASSWIGTSPGFRRRWRDSITICGH
jgi:transposase